MLERDQVAPKPLVSLSVGLPSQLGSYSSSCTNRTINATVSSNIFRFKVHCSILTCLKRICYNIHNMIDKMTAQNIIQTYILG